MPEHVTTDHSEVNGLIYGLREIAAGVKRVGDECVRLESALDKARDERDIALDSLHGLEAQNDSAANELHRWSELLEDFRLGVRDSDELLRQTLGRT